MRKIPTRLRGTNFCTSSAHFAPSFVRQPKGSKRNQILQNAPIHQFRVQWGGSDVFVAKNSNATSWHELLQERSACFPQSFVRQPNDPECTQIVRNAPKHQFRVQWGGLGVFVAKNSDATSWHELLQKRSARFPQSFVRQPNGRKRTKNVSLGSNGLDRVSSLRKILMPLRGTNFCTSSARFAPSFVSLPNGHECTQIV